MLPDRKLSMEILCNYAKIMLEFGLGQCISQGSPGKQNQQDIY